MRKRQEIKKPIQIWIREIGVAFASTSLIQTSKPLPTACSAKLFLHHIFVNSYKVYHKNEVRRQEVIFLYTRCLNKTDTIENGLFWARKNK